MNVIYPPHAVIVNERPTLFIAGSIAMGAASRWQEEAIRSLDSYKGTLLNPRRKGWNASWQQVAENPKFREQVDWELNGVERSDIIAFYFQPGTSSPITLLELGFALGLGKRILIACPLGFWRKGNVDIIASRHSLVVHESLPALIRALQAVLPTL